MANFVNLEFEDPRAAETTVFFINTRTTDQQRLIRQSQNERDTVLAGVYRNRQCTRVSYWGEFDEVPHGSSM